MARTKRTALGTPGAAQHMDVEQEIRGLREKIEWLDALVKEAAGDVDALVTGARAAMMSGHDPIAVYRLLGSIGHRVDHLMNQVNDEAAETGVSLPSEVNSKEEILVFQRWHVDLGRTGDRSFAHRPRCDAQAAAADRTSSR